jgi:trigger factor
MSNVVREDIDALNAVLTVTVSKENYLAKFNKELAKYKDKARMKGFRQGKTPESLVRKLYGKPVLSEILDNEFQHQLYHYLDDNKLNLIGSPILSEETDKLDINVEQMLDYTMKFDIALQPDFEIDGLNKIQVFDHYEVEVSDETANNEFDDAMKSLGERVESAAEILAGDLVKLQAVNEELGIENEFSLEWDSMSEDLKSQLLNSKIGDSLNLDPLKLEEGRDEAFSKRYFLGLETDDIRELPATFDFKITSASRVEMPEITEENLHKVFGEEINTREEALAEIKKAFKRQHVPMADAILFRHFQDRLMELNQFELPEKFIQRFYQVNNEGLGDEQAKKLVESSRRALNWDVLSSKMSRKFNISISEKEVRQELMNTILGYLGGQMQGMSDFIMDWVERMMKEEKSVTEAQNRVFSRKLHQAIEQEVSINTVLVSEERLKEIWDELVKSAKTEEEVELAALDAGSEDAAEVETEA